MKQVYIIGAGGFGREVFEWMHDVLEDLEAHEFVGFLDDNSEALDGFDIEASVVGTIKDYSIKENDLLICAIGDPATKRAVCEPLLESGSQFLSLIHPSARIGRRCEIATGVVIGPGVILTCDVSVGAMVMINIMSTAGHDVSVGAWSTVSAHCDLTGGVQLGESVFMGSGARVIPQQIVGESSVIGAGSVVIRPVLKNETVFGNPARPLS